jgi:hypothetical protein
MGLPTSVALCLASANVAVLDQLMLLAAVVLVVLVVDLQLANQTPSIKIKNIFFILVVSRDDSTQNIAEPFKLFY